MLKKILKLLRYIRAYFLIPRGSYCYFGTRAPGDEKHRLCPFWEFKKDVPKYEFVYCHYENIADGEINDDSIEFKNKITGKMVKASDISFSIGLLWDQCKECDVKTYIFAESE